MSKRFRDADDGKFVSKAAAEADPKGTVAETIRPNANDLEKEALQLCYEIEKLPASEQQTIVITMASAIYRKIKNL